MEKLVSSPYVNHTQHKTPLAAKLRQPAGVASYEISPYRCAAAAWRAPGAASPRAGSELLLAA